MHMHLVAFQILNRFALDGSGLPTGPPIPPEPYEIGWKDTARAEAQMITRVIARFEDYPGKFAYHCHILEHEDLEMMRTFRVVAVPEPSSLAALAAAALAFLAVRHRFRR